MGYRRQAKILEIVKEWKDKPSYSETLFSCGHLKTLENTLFKGRYTACKICAYNQSKRYRDEKRKTNRINSNATN